MKYCFDIDDTLLSYYGDYNKSTPIQHRIDRVNELYDRGHHIILMTARGQSSGKDYTDFTREQVKKFGIKHHELIMNKKPNADVFIDDKGLRVDQWDWDYRGFRDSCSVWVNGCFDVLHRGHIELLKFARGKAEGCEVIVGVDSDERVRKAKGKDRPVNTLEDRLVVLQSLSFVDRVFSFDTDDELVDLLKQHAPKYRVIGSDYKTKPIVGEDYSGEIVYYDLKSGYSSTCTIEKLKQEA